MTISGVLRPPEKITNGAKRRTIATAAYFIGRLIAYKTNMFKNAKDRDNVLICVFAVLAIVFIMLAIALI